MTRYHLKILRFALVGVGVAAFYVGLYVGFLAVGFPQLFANALAFLLAIVVQYFGQAMYTFRAPVSDAGQVVRFGVMIGAGLLTSAVVTGGIGPAFGWPDWVAAACVTIILPIQNFVIISRWVFVRQMKPLETSK